MPFNSGISSQLDINQIALAVSRPGIDPRVWLSLAIVKKFHVSSDGVFVDVTLHPTDVDETVRMGAIYAGNGFGLYAPLHVDDEVLVSFPDGDPDSGGVIIARLWSKADPPPGAAKDNDADVILVVEKDKNLRLTVQGDGDVIVNGGSLRVARKTDPVKTCILAGTAGPFPVNFVVTPYQVQNGEVVPGVPAAPSTAAMIGGLISDGAEHFKG